MTTESSLPGAWRGASLELAGLAGPLLDQLAAVVAAVDPAGAITYWNPEAERAYGWSIEEVRGRPIDELVGDGSALATVLAGQRWQGDLRVRAKSGGTVAGWASIDPLRLPDGGIAGAVAVIVPAAPQSVHDQLAVVLDSVDAAIIMRHISGELVYANQAAAVALGFDRPEELLAASGEQVRARFVAVDASGEPVPDELLPGRLALTTGESISRTLRFRVADTGEDRWALIHATPVLDDDGAVTDAISIFQDVTTQRRTEESLAFLAEAGAMLGRSIAWESTLQEVARLAVPTFADWCIVDVIEDDQAIRRVAIAAADPRDEELLEELRDRYSPTWDSPQPAAMALRAGAPVIVDQFTPESLAQTVRDANHGRILSELAPRSTIALPLVAHGRTLGAITFAWSRSGRVYQQEDLQFAEEIAQRASLAVANARLFRAEREAREQLVFLAEASALLADSLDIERTLESVARLAVPRLADWCVIDVLETDETVRRVAVVCADPSKRALAEELQRSYPDTPRSEEGTAKVLASGEPELIADVTDEWIAAMAPDERQFEILRSLGLRSNILVPLNARGRTIGVLAIATAESGRVYGRDELAVADDLARRAAMAVDNARLFHEAEARGEAARALAYVADGVILLDEDGVVRFWNPAAAAITGLAAVDVLGRPVGEAIPGWAGVAERVPVATGPGAGARAETLPLELGGREVWLSMSAVGFGEGTVYAFRDLTEERALERLRSDFVSTVSHELRTPLSAIYGAALTLRRDDVTLAEEQRDNLLGVIAGEAERLARTVNDILWASRLDSGTMHLAISSCDGVELARGVIDSFRTHIPHGVELRLGVDGEPPLAAGDPDKVRQVLANFVENAVKYSPDGGLVEVEVAGRAGVTRFSVSDRGLGIPVGEQRRIFEKFYRLDPNLTRGVGGTGLGLYICQELVNRMGGRIWVESRPGGGSVFAFELPAA